MPRVQFSDVTPPEKRSIRNIPIPTGGRRRASAPAGNVNIKRVASPEPAYEEPKFPEPAPTKTYSATAYSAPIEKQAETGPYEYYYPKKEPEYTEAPMKRSKKTWVLGGAAGLLIVSFIVGMMTVFASATIDITPKSKELTVSKKLPAFIEANEGGVRYEIVKLSKTKTASVAATGEEAVEEKASGKIIIYNNFSTEPQRLIIRTRFESPEGLIYRISESVVVPGKTVKDGAETPGSIEAQVYADEAGEKYNIKKTDFTVPGFKTDAARFKGFYARSSTSMTGGFIGKRKTVSPAEKQTAMQNIDSEAQTELQKELGTKVPEGLALLPGSVIYKSSELPAAESGSSVALSKEVTAYAVLLNSSDLSKRLAEEYVADAADWKGIPANVADFSGLKISNIAGSIETGGKLEIQIDGQAKAWADIDPEAIKQNLVGAPKSAAGQLMVQFAGISSLKSTLRPIWKRSFPENPSKIYINSNING